MLTASTEILLDMVTRMNDHKMGLVHQLPFTTDQSGFAAAVEKVMYSFVFCLNLFFCQRMLASKPWLLTVCNTSFSFIQL